MRLPLSSTGPPGRQGGKPPVWLGRWPQPGPLRAPARQRPPRRSGRAQLPASIAAPGNVARSPHRIMSEPCDARLKPVACRGACQYPSSAGRPAVHASQVAGSICPCTSNPRLSNRSAPRASPRAGLTVCRGARLRRTDQRLRLLGHLEHRQRTVAGDQAREHAAGRRVDRTYALATSATSPRK